MHRPFGWKQWLILLAFVLTLTVTSFFAVRTVRRALYWRAHRDEPIREWMSVNYVARSYSVPPHVLYRAIGLPPERGRDRRPLRRIAEEQNRPVEELIAELQNAIIHARPPYPPPPPPDNSRAP